MRKVINISGKEVPLGTNGLVPLLYKKEFGSDFFGDIQKMSEKDIEVEILYNFLWVFARVEDKEIPPLWEWLESFETVPISDIAADIVKLATACITTKKVNASKKKIT